MIAENYEETRIRHKISHHHVESISQDSVIKNKIIEIYYCINLLLCL